MIVAPLLLSCLALAGAQHLFRKPSSGYDQSWTTTFPELNSPRISEQVFRDNKEYRYIYDGQILTGLPEAADQYSGLRIRAIVTLQLRTGPDVLKIEKATLGRLNEQSIDGPLDMQPASDFDELTGDEAKEWNTALTKPLRFQYDDNTGTVSDLESLDSDPFWSVNIKRSILATFNLKLKDNQAGPLSHPRFAAQVARQQQRQRQRQGQDQKDEDDIEYFSVMEEGIGGKCEATYMIQPVPARDNRDARFGHRSAEQALNVTKAWNYDNCESRPIFLDSLNSGDKCVGQDTESPKPGCGKDDSDEQENVIDSASHTKYSLRGNANDFMIEEADTEAVHKFAPYSDKAGSVTAYVKASLKLIYAGEWQRDSILPSERGIPQRGLRQLFPQHRDTDFTMQSLRDASDRADVQFLQSSGQWENVAAKKTIVKALLDRLVEDLADDEVEPESANLVLQMSVILTYATPEEIAEIHAAVKGMARKSVDQEQVENLWFDTLALTGTKPAVKYIKREIQNQNLDGERAAQVLNTLAFSIRKPDQDIVKEIRELCKQPTVAGHSGMRKACWLSFGTLAHASCVDDVETTASIQNTAVKPGNPQCNGQTRKQFAAELLGRMKTSQTEEDKILVLKTLGNTGFIEALDDLKEIFEDDRESTIIRVNALYAVSRAGKTYPDHVLEAVLPEYHDRTNPYQVRIAAFDVAVEANPDLAHLELIARSLQEEKSIQVGSYVWSKLNSLANATHPCFEKLNKNAGIALEFAKPFQTGLSYSKSIHFDGYSDEHEIGGFAEINTIGDPSSIIPRSANFRLNAHVLGLSHDIVEAGVETTGINGLIKKFAMSRKKNKNGNDFFDFFNDDDTEEILREGRHPSHLTEERRNRKSFERPEFDEIDRLLGLQDRADEEIQASAYLKIFGQEVRFMTISPKSIMKSIAEAYLSPADVRGLARGQLTIDHRKALMAADTEITLPTELGLPLTLEMKAPVVISVKGTVGLKTQPDLQSAAGRMRWPQTVTAESDVKVSVATEIHGKMTCWAAFLKIGAGVRAQVSTVIPINGDVTVDLKTGKVETTMDMPQEPVELIKIEVMPMTYTKAVPKSLVPHQPDRKDPSDNDRSEKVVQFNRQPMANELPTEFFSFKTDLDENPFMLSQSGRPSTKFYEGLPVPVVEIKEIDSFDALKTKLVSMTVGHRAFGFIVDVKGQVQIANGVPHTPLLPVGGKNLITVTLHPTKTGLKSVSAAVHFRKQHTEGSTRADYKNLFDKMVDYKTSGLLERLSADVPSAFAKDDQSAYSAQLIVQGTTGSRPEVTMQGVVSLVRGMDGKFVKVAAELTSPHSEMPFQVCVNGHAEYPEEYDSWNLNKATNKPVTGRLEFGAGRSCNAPEATKVKVNFVSDKSPEQQSFEKNDVYSIEGSVIPQIVSKSVDPMAYILKPAYQECENDRKQGARWSRACQTVKDIYSELMQMKIDIDYQNVPSGIKVLLDKAEQTVLAMYHWNAEVDNVLAQNPPNRVTILADFSDDETVDIVYSTPWKNAKLLGMPVPYPLGPIQAEDEPLNIWEALLQEDLDDICSISGNRVNTLDNAKLQVTPSGCWSLLAKDNSPQELWSVLYAQAGSRQADGKKVLAFIGDKKIELQPASSYTSGRQIQSSSDFTAKVNGRRIELSEQDQSIDNDEDIEISIETDGDASAPYVAISAPEYGIELWFDGHSIALKPTQWLRNQVTGLCGNGNGEEWDDMQLPNGKQAKDFEELIRGYTVRKDGCSADAFSPEELRSPSQYPFAQRQQQKDSRCGQLKTIVKFRPGKVCFSVDPVEVCPPWCNAGQDDQDDSAEHEMVRRAGFHCMPEDSSLGQRLLQDANQRVLTEVSMKPVNDYFAVPQGTPGCGGRGKTFRGRA
jgi:hypothetical protein